MLTDLVVEAFTRTDAAGSRRGARVRWTAPPSTEVVVRWHYRADPAPWDPWLQSDSLTASSFELFPAAPGRYEFHVFAQQPGVTFVDHGYFELPIGPLLESELELPKPSGLELVGPSGELLGDSGSFVGRDLRLRWSAVRLDALYTDGAGEAPDDGLIEFAEVRVVGPGAAVLRSETLPVHQTEWIYSYARNAEDQPLTVDPASAVRDVRLEVRWKDRTGRLGPPAVLEVEHTLQLSATADIEELATFALTEVVDAGDLSPTMTIATYIFVDEVEVEGVGYPVQVQFTDRFFWTTNAYTPLEYFFLKYRLRIIDEFNVVVASIEQEVIESWGWAQQLGDIFQQANLTLRATLELGVTYRLQVHVYWDRPIGTVTVLDYDSLHRRWLVTDLKR